MVSPGAVVDPRGLDELLPDWKTTAPIESPVTQRRAVVHETRGGKLGLPVPPRYSITAASTSPRFRS